MTWKFWNKQEKTEKNPPGEGRRKDSLYPGFIDTPWGTLLFWPVVLLILVGVTSFAIVLDYYRTIGQANFFDELLFSVSVISIATVVGYIVAFLLKLTVRVVDILAVMFIGHIFWQMGVSLTLLLDQPVTPFWLAIMVVLVIPVAVSFFALCRWTNVPASAALAVVMVGFVVANIFVYTVASAAGMWIPGI